MSIYQEFGRYVIALSPRRAAVLIAGLGCAASMSLQAQPRAYVTNQASEDKVWVIETVTNTVVDTVTLEDVPSRVAITPDGAFAYVTIVVNEDFLQQSGAILPSPVTSSPVFMGSPLSKSSLSSSFFSNKVDVIDTSTNTVVATVTTDVAPFGIGITPSGEFAYVTHLGPNVKVIDTSTNTVVATIPVGAEAFDVAFSPDGAFAYVPTSGSDVLTVIDTASNSIVTTVEVGETPSGIAVTPDGAFAYVTNLSSDTVSQISLAENTLAATLAVGDGPGSIAITPDGASAYVTNQLSNDVSVIDIGTNAVATAVAVGDTPIDVAITPDGELAYVTNIFSDSVSVIDTATNTLADTVAAGFLPEGIAITPEAIISVTIDIKPGNAQNRVNPTSRGGLWVAVLTDDQFDALQINIDTVRFGRNEAIALRHGVRDVDHNGSGDLLLRFSTEAAGIQCGDSGATLSGQTFLQQQFSGTDTLETVGCQEKAALTLTNARNGR